jgi:hypothetical protein
MPKAAQKIQQVGSTQKAAPDFLIENHGSVFLLRPLTDAARSWIDEHIGADNGFQPMYPTVLIEHRYISAIVRGLVEEGWACR